MGCSCAKCVAACRTKPGLLGPADVENLPHDKLVASEGTDMMQPDGRRVHVLTIVPESRPDGSCVFLVGGRCTVHGEKPAGCRDFDACASEPAEMLRGHLASQRLYQEIVRDLAEDGPYCQLWRRLMAAGRVAAPITERIAAYKKAMADVDRKRFKKRRRRPS